MYLSKTSVPGMFELSGVGYGGTQKDYDTAMTPTNLKGCSIVVASLTTSQKPGIALLLKNGFVQTGKPRRNPNTDHMIVVLIKYVK